MCRTSSPPRRELYELETELRANDGPSFLPKNKPGRIGGASWMEQRATTAIAVYNANYTPTGLHLHQWFSNPWTALGPNVFRTFPTHAEALAYAFEKAVTK